MPPVPRRPRALTRYFAIVTVASAALALAGLWLWGAPADWFAVLALSILGGLAWWLPATTSDGRSTFTLDNIVVLAAITLTNPVGAGIVGASMAALSRRRIDLPRRVFNMAVFATAAMVAGLGYDLAGGAFGIQELRGAGEVIWTLGVPMLVADAVHLVVNAVLVAGAISFGARVPWRHQLIQMLLSTGPSQFAYGVIALSLVVLWSPAGLGVWSVLVVLAPLLGARWALLLYGEERLARERALGALSAAIETRAPQLQGHGVRVSELAARMAQELGLGPQQVADVRTAGLLHDLGRVVVAPGSEGPDGATSAALREEEMLRGLPFLAGASSVMQEVALGSAVTGEPSLGASIVLAADAYDLLTHGDQPVPGPEALSTLRADGQSRDERVLTALEAAVGDDAMTPRPA